MKLKQVFGDVKQAVCSKAAKVASGVGAGVTLLVEQANAAVDTAAATTAVQAAQTSAEGMGGVVIAGVAGLVVIGLIIGIVKKL